MNRIKGIFVLIGGLLWSIVQYPVSKLKEFDQWCAEGRARRTWVVCGFLFAGIMFITWVRG